MWCLGGKRRENFEKENWFSRFRCCGKVGQDKASEYGCVRGPQTSLRPDELLEGLIGLRKAGIFVVKFSTARGHKLKSAKWRGSWSKVQEKSGVSSRGSFSRGVAQTCSLLNNNV